MSAGGDGPRLESVAWRHGPPARVELRREGGRTTAVVHASVTPLVKGGLALWLGAWALGELVALRLAGAAAGGPLPFFHGFALFFLSGWTVMGLLAGRALWWCYQGTEELSSDGRELTFRRQVGGLGRTRRFALEKVRGPSVRYDGWVTAVEQVPPDALVRLAFETRWSTYRLNASLRHADALGIVAALARRPGGRPSGQAGWPGHLARPGAPDRPGATACPPPLPPR